MALAEVAVICFSLVSAVGIASYAYFESEIRKQQLHENEITKREIGRGRIGGDGSTSQSYSGRQEWWQPLAVELLKNPQIQNMILSKVAPTLTQQPQTITE